MSKMRSLLTTRDGNVWGMATIREMRLTTGYSQREFAARLDISLQTYRPYDSARRSVPGELLERAARLLEEHRRRTQLLTMDALAHQYGIHPRTLRAAARDGRLKVHFSNRAVFGRSVRLASQGAVDDFVHAYYRQRYSRFAAPLPPVPVTAVPANFASRIIGVRMRLRLTQGELAHRIGAANKAVVYQWESGKRTPSTTFWRRIETLIAYGPTPQAVSTRPQESSERLSARRQPLRVRIMRGESSCFVRGDQ